MTVDRVELRRLAEEAKPGARGDAGAGRWDAFFTVHGDPHVVEEGGRGLFGHVATVGTSPDDYGRARALYLAAVNPAVVLELLDRLELLEGIGDVLVRLGPRRVGNQSHQSLDAER